MAFRNVAIDTRYQLPEGYGGPSLQVGGDSNDCIVMETKIAMADEANPFRTDLTHVVRGFCMGSADIVPGVSGGTVALVLGIYERLVTAISHFDLRLARLLRERRWKAVAEHIDLRFLSALAVGIGGGFVVMTVLMNLLLSNDVTRPMTFSAFLGLILGSAIVVALMIQIRSRAEGALCLGLGLAAGVFAFWISTLHGGNVDPTYGYIFLCGCIAICAMILPGISGAMILVILGVYLHLTEIPKNLLHGELVVEGLITIAVFVIGAAVSLVTFSKFLRWLLKHFHTPTMAVLCGFMIGALPKLWPFQQMQPGATSIKHARFEPYVPDQINSQVLIVATIFLAAAILVVVVERLANRRSISSERRMPGQESQ